MRIIYLNRECPGDLAESVATIGFFDGVHRGHQFLVNHVVDTAHRENRQAMVITFDCHPREVLRADFQPRLLTTLAERLRLLEHTGVDTVAVLHFDEAMAGLSAQAFMCDVLLGQLRVMKLFIGYDHRFGHNRAEGFADYVRYGREMGMEVVQSPAFELEGINVSSTVCRRYVAEGEMEKAAHSLGYPYMLEGTVTHGYRKGRELGFPTANLVLSDSRRLVPALGVYAVKVRIGQEAAWRMGMMNIGTRPTFGGNELSLEVHVLNFSDNLYGQMLQVAFLSRVREERRFDSADALARQLEKDKQMIIKLENNGRE